MLAASERMFSWSGRLNLPRLPRYVALQSHSHVVDHGMHDSDVVDTIAHAADCIMKNAKQKVRSGRRIGHTAVAALSDSQGSHSLSADDSRQDG